MLTYILRKSPPLCGEIAVQRSKNAVLPEIAAALLTREPVTLLGVPEVSDAENMLALLFALGVQGKREKGRLTLCADALAANACDIQGTDRLRGSVLLLGPLLARCGEARLLLPGGCAIGSRPLDQHMKGLCSLGVHFTAEEDGLYARCEGLHGAHIRLDVPSVGATENVLLASTLAEGETLLENAACEPEIGDLIALLRKMGANIRGAGTPVLAIQGVAQLHGAQHTPMADRIAAGTYLMMVLATGGDVLLKGVRERELSAVLHILRCMGGDILREDGGLRTKGRVRFPVQVATAPYPGFPTDLQAPLMALLTTVSGVSQVTERIFENRYLHVPEMRKMGANIILNGNRAEIFGGIPLYGTQVAAPDLRAGAALMLCGLVAEGETRILHAEHIERGYEDICGVLRRLGAGIIRQETA